MHSKMFILLILAFIALKTHTFIGALYANAGAVDVYKAAVNSCNNCSEMVSAREKYSRAVMLDGLIASWHENLGLINYQYGNYPEAARNLEAALALNSHPRTWASLGKVYLLLNDNIRAVNAIDNGEIYSKNSDKVLARLLLAEQYIWAGDWNRARKELDAVLELSPDHLWVWTQYLKHDLVPLAKSLEKVVYYQIPYLENPTEANFYIGAAVELLDIDLWTIEDALLLSHVLLARSFLEEAYQFLLTLKIQFPDDTRIVSLEAEILSQLGDSKPSAILLEEAVKAGSISPSSWCEAGDNWSRSGAWDKAKEAMMTCLASNPKDLGGLVGLQKICKQTGDISCLQNVTSQLSRISVSATAGEMLGIPEDEISLGTDLIINGGFESPDYFSPRTPQSWVVYTWDGKQHDRAAFYFDLDNRSWSGERAGMLAGFWRLKTELPSSAYIEYVTSPVWIQANSAYVFSFFYRTEHMQGYAFIADGLSESPTFDPYNLPPTDGRWKQLALIGFNSTPEGRYIRPILRLWGLGVVWFDDVKVNHLLNPIIGQSFPPLIH
jgi:tetratricopeptide (TPR) repeat protein